MARRLTRAQVVGRAGDLADELGLEAVTITRLGRDLGIAPPSVYRHVHDVADLRRALGRMGSHELAVVIAGATAGLAGIDALRGLATAMRAWASEHPGRYAALQVAPEPEDEDGVAAAHTLMAVFESALRAYRLAGDDLVDALRLVRSTLHGFIVLEQVGGFRMARSPDASFDRAIRGLDRLLTDRT